MAPIPCLRIAAVGAIALLLAACGKEETAPPPVRPVLVVHAGAAAATAVSYVGEIRTRHEADLGFRIGGKIIARLADVGSEVSAGQVLARIDPADAALQARQADAALALAESEAHRYRDLRAKNFVSQAALDVRETTLQQAQAQAAISRNQADYATLRADHAGAVTAVLADVGQVVAAGQGVLRVAQKGDVEVAIAVPEGQVEALRTAGELRVSPWAQPDEHFAGKLRELAPAADAATRTFPARITILHPSPLLRLGMTATVSLPTSASSGILVPAAAVADGGNGPAVWIVAGEHVSRRPVKVRQMREDGVVVDGVQAGELIVAAGAQKLTEGQAVRAQLLDAGSGGRQ
jgi:multidrug efflux system membrane fusion protein